MKIRLICSASLLALMPVLMTGCTLAENHLKINRDNNLDVQDVRDSLAPRELPAEKTADASAQIPEFADYTSADMTDLQPMPLVTISVNESVPLKDVLYELAQQANYDVELDPRIRGAIIFSAKNRPFDEVMERIADLASLRYKFKNNVVRVELDSPYTETYKLDYLPMVRTVSTTVQNNASFAGSGDSGGASSSGSTFTLNGKNEIDFWKELDTNIKQILESNSTENALRTQKTPTVVEVPANNGGTTPPPAPGSADDPAAGATAVTSATVPTNIEAVPDPSSPDSGAAQGEDENAVEFTPTYSVNKQAGLISVYANEKVQRKIKSYLDDLRHSVSAQVLIEAKVLEVSLTDEYAAGIQWNDINFGIDKLSMVVQNPMPSFATASDSVISMTYSGGGDLNSLIQAVSRFGSVHALASPRLTVLNNQSAVLNVATNRTYFEISESTTSTTDGGTTSGGGLEVEPKSVPEGVLVNVTPTIDRDTGEITMTVRPTITKIDGFVSDPGFQAIAASRDLDGIQNLIPNLSVQEFDSVLRVKSGDVVVMGGLMRDTTRSEQNGLPVLGEAPLIGGLFRSQGDKISKTELVVFLRATIVNGGKDTIHQTDRDLYRIYSQDRRPFPL